MFVSCDARVINYALINKGEIINAFVSSISLFPVALFLGYIFSQCKNIYGSTVFHTFYDFFVNYI